MPENATPDSTTPASTAPANAAPGSATPDQAALGSATPDQAALGSATTDQAAPDRTAPATAGPGEMSLYTAMLGEADRRLGWLLEGMMTAQVASVLARLAIPDELAAGPLTAIQIASRIGADPGALDRLLSAAAVYGLVRKDDARRYALAPTGDLLRTDAEGSARGVAVGFLGPPLWQSTGRLEEIVRSPDPVNPARPGGIYEYYGRHPEEAAWFAQAMGRVTGMMVDQLTAAAFRPLVSGRIVDVGGSRGTLLAYLLRVLPDASGVLMDRAEALGFAPGFLAGAGVGDRVELVTGDFLREVPPGGDLYVLSQILHNWEDGPARTIVRNCHRASRPGGVLMVIDYVLPEGPEPSLAHLMDLIMMMVVGGRERTRAQHEALLGPEGYELVRDTPVPGVLPWRVLEFRHV